MAKIEERIVSMKFDNGQFESGVSKTLGTLGKLKDSLRLKESSKAFDNINASAKNVNLSAIAAGVNQISENFSKMGVIGVTALANITNRVLNAGLAFAKSFTVTPMTDGFKEYENKMGSIQTMMANTKQPLETVNKALDELNAYSDKTIYSFADMTANAALFTNAGMKVEQATSVIKGFSNEAAASGANSEKAAGAAYQLSQAMSAGTIRLMDWRSLTNANMGNKNMQSGLIEIAGAMGTLDKAGISATKVQSDFNGSLEKGWLSADVMSTYLGIMANEDEKSNRAKMKSIGLTDKQIDQFVKQQKTAQDAATMVRTATALIGTAKESVGSMWASAFQIVIGDFNQATALFTGINNKIRDGIGAMSKSLNGTLAVWADSGGRKAAIQGFVNVFQALGSVLKPIGAAFREVFAPMNGHDLTSASLAFESFTSHLKMGSAVAEGLKNTFKVVFATIKLALTILGAVLKVVAGAAYLVVRAFMMVGGWILIASGYINGFIAKLALAVANFDLVGKATGWMASGMKFLGNKIAEVNGKLPTQAQMLERIHSILTKLRQVYADVARAIAPFVEQAQGIKDAFKPEVVSLMDRASTAMTNFGATLRSFGGNVKTDGLALLGRAAQGLRDNLERAKLAIDAFKSKASGVGGAMKDAGTATQDAGTSAYEQGLTKTRALMVGVKTLAEGIGSSLANFGREASKLGPYIESGAKGVWFVLEKVASVLGDISKGLSGQDFAGLTTLAVIVATFRGFSTLISPIKAFSSVLEGAGSALAGFGTKMKAQAIILIAGAILILAAALWVLAQIPQDRLQSSMTSLGAVAAGLGIFMAGLNKVLAGEDAIGTAKLIALGLALVIVAAAMAIMARAAIRLAGLDYGSMGKGLSGVAAIMIMMSGLMAAMNKFNPQNAVKNAIAIFIIAVSINALVKTIEKFAAMDLGTMAKGMGALTASLAILVGTMRLMPKDAAALGISVGVALGALTLALKVLGDMPVDKILKGAITIAAIMGILVVAINLMSANVAGTAALAGLAIGLNMLVAPIALLGAMSWEGIIKGLVGLAGAMLVLVAGIALLSLLGPALVVLGPGLLMLSGALFLAGAAMTLFGGGIATLAAVVVASGTVLLAWFAALIALLPVLGSAVAGMITNFVEGLLSGLPAMLSAAQIMFQAVFALLMALAPQVISLAQTYMMELLQIVGAAIPKIATLGYNLIVGFVGQLRAGMPKILHSGYEIMMTFFGAIMAQLPTIVQAGMDVAIRFIDSLTGAIRSNGPRLRESMRELGKAMIDAVKGGLEPGPAVSAAINVGREIVNGVASGIRDFASNAVAEAERMVSKVLSIIKSVPKIASPSRVTMGFGKFIAQGLALGIRRDGDLPVQAAGMMAEDTMSAMRSAMETITGAFDAEVQAEPVITPVIDLAQAAEGARKLNAMMSANAARSVSTDLTARARLDGLQVAAEAKAPQGPATVVFNQYNNSPKELSALDIYRNTQAQLAMAGGGNQ